MGGAHAEDIGEDGDVGGEREVVVGYSQGQDRTLDRVIAKQAFASSLSNTPVVVGAVKGQAPVASLYVEAALIFAACVSSSNTFVYILAAAPVSC